ncbi:hypothetical protein [Legionella sp. km772]|uniref:hypothetical protein n=1 Tax=Legionella sp. km772 TaxID=2498111 RepID=UPI000F8E21E9|nr:hypothetical protein [Legionella sp. km772]RUR04577.1 hypothetical protein ELY15_15345 [Legionella sp. km772]
MSYPQVLEFSELRTDLLFHLDNYPVFENSKCFELEYLHIKRNECIEHHNTVVSGAEEFFKRANELQNQAWLNERARNSVLLKNSFMESMDTEVSSRTNDVSENKSSPRLQ